MGAIFKIPGYIVYFVAGLWGFFISLGIVVDHLGFIGGAIAFFLAPVTLAFAPWYEAIANSNWFPMLLVYGGFIGATILVTIGSAIDGE
ncbi:hypothetical protein [Thiohalomonas denitrificans]|uniref:hypothetical protein n=1 Tax=Thiohalomonas denitrificans TaxID=415747 RepID=UPI0026EDA2B0|nr:hypothetical protein [Thiohalomonas denitrificans]